MADQKVTDLTAITTFSGDESLYVVEDDDGSPVSRQTTIENLASGLAAQTGMTGAFVAKESSGTWTPTVTAGSGSFTSVAATGRETLMGGWCFFNLDVTITTNGTAAASVSATMNRAALSGHTFIFAGREDAVTGVALISKLPSASSTLTIWKTDNTYPGGDGRILRLSGCYRYA